VRTSTLTHRDPDAEFHGTRSVIAGEAVYEYDYEREGRSHSVFNTTLLYVDCDGLKLTRDQMVLMMGKSGVEYAEQLADGAIYNLYQSGDMEAA
jgi:hypothetical protein